MIGSVDMERSALTITSAAYGRPPWTVAAWLCMPREPLRRELHIVLHGGTYDHRYWDWPLNSHDYSYVGWAAERGIATLAIDRIGAGASSKPPGRDVTMTAQVGVVGEIVDKACAGEFGFPFERIVVVGHSLGSVVAAAVGARHERVDAVVLTGYLGVGSDVLNDDPRLLEHFHSALADPALAHLTGLIDDGYLTVRSESRIPLFYVEEAADREVIELDEKMKSTMTVGEFSDVGTVADCVITVPTLVVLGQHDVLFFDAEQESDTFGSTSRSKGRVPSTFEFEVIPGVGHNLNLHPGARETYGRIEAWLDRTAGSGTIAS